MGLIQPLLTGALQPIIVETQQQATTSSGASSSVLKELRPEGFENPLADYDSGLILRSFFEAICPDLMTSQAPFGKIARLANRLFGYTYPKEERWELATLLAANPWIRSWTVLDLFHAIIQKLEEKQTEHRSFHFEISSSEKLRIWDIVSPKRLEKLEKMMTESLSDALAAEFDEREIKEMLTSCRAAESNWKRRLIPKCYQLRLSEVIKAYYASSIDVAKAAVKTMREDFSREVVEALGFEAVELSWEEE